MTLGNLRRHRRSAYHALRLICSNPSQQQTEMRRAAVNRNTADPDAQQGREVETLSQISHQ